MNRANPNPTRPAGHCPVTSRARRQARALALAAALAGLAAPAAAQVRLPDFGDSSASVFSPAEEREIGEAFMREIRATVTVVEDGEVEEYVQNLGYRLVTHSDQAYGGFRFFVVVDEGINAFAAPGGFVGFNSGLLLATESESEFASVVAHETAHVLQRHIARSIEAADRSNIPAIAGMLAAILIGTQNPTAGQAAAAAVMGTTVQQQIDVIRSNEIEADRVGMQLLEKAGFDPRAMPTFFERLQGASRYYRRPPEFLSTHPVTSSRISDTRSRAEQYPYRHYVDSDGFAYVRAKLRVLSEPQPPQAVAWFREALAKPAAGNAPALRYGLALALTRTGKPEEAHAILTELVGAQPERVGLRAALGDSLLESGKVPEAAAVYADAYQLYPDSKLLLRGYSRVLLRAGRGREVLRLLEDYARLHAMDASLYWLSAEAHEQAGNPIESKLQLAEHYYLKGRLDEAIQQLQIALHGPGTDFYRSSRLEARLQQLRDEKAQRTRRR